MSSQCNSFRESVTKSESSHASMDTRRAWVIEQLAALIRKRGVLKSIETMELALDWMATHAFFEQKPSKKAGDAVSKSLPDRSRLSSSCD